jgi:hypothetical protein
MPALSTQQIVHGVTLVDLLGVEVHNSPTQQNVELSGKPHRLDSLPHYRPIKEINRIRSGHKLGSFLPSFLPTKHLNQS